MNNFTLHTVLAAILCGLFSSVAAATDCSRSDIDHYLDRGFTPAQIVELCGKTTADAADPQQPSKNATEGKESNETIRAEIYLQSALDAEEVLITPTALVMIHDRCLPYGDTDILDMKARACLVMETTLPFNDLEIASVIKPVVLLRDGQFLVNANIERKITDSGKLRGSELETFHHDYPKQSSSINLPIKEGFSYEKVAEALRDVIRTH